MGKKRNVMMDETQEEVLKQRSTNKYSSSSSYDLPEEFAMIAAMENRGNTSEKTPQKDQETTDETAKTKVVKKHGRSKRYLSLKKKAHGNGSYSIAEGVKLLFTLSKEKFDPSIELHLLSKKDTLSGKLELPHGTGKQKKVVIFDENVLAKIEAKQTDFDVLIAKPEDMPKLARYAKFLGPKGLMPNPKNGTVTKDPQKALQGFSGNAVDYKTEKKAPLVHLTVGKRSFGEDKIIDNLKAVFAAVNPKQLVQADISSSMSPGIRLNLESLQ